MVGWMAALSEYLKLLMVTMVHGSLNIIIITVFNGYAEDREGKESREGGVSEEKGTREEKRHQETT